MNAFAVGYDDESRLVPSVVEQFGDMASIIRADVKAARSFEDVAEALAGEPDRWGIDQRLNFMDMITDFVAIAQGVQNQVLLIEIIGLPDAFGLR